MELYKAAIVHGCLRTQDGSDNITTIRMMNFTRDRCQIAGVLYSYYSFGRPIYRINVRTCHPNLMCATYIGRGHVRTYRPDIFDLLACSIRGSGRMS
jgi:hypothetical protein